jgi:hypothetical protein
MVPNHAHCVGRMSEPVDRSNSAAMRTKNSSNARNTAPETGNTANLAWLS